MTNNQKITSADLLNTLKTDPEAIRALTAMIESGALTVDNVSTYAAMLPKTSQQIEYSLVSSFNEIHHQTQHWMKIDDVISHIRMDKSVVDSITDSMIEYYMDNSRYIDHSFLYGVKHYRMKAMDIEFDAVEIYWGELVNLLGRKEAHRLFSIAQAAQSFI